MQKNTNSGIFSHAAFHWISGSECWSVSSVGLLVLVRVGCLQVALFPLCQTVSKQASRQAGRQARQGKANQGKEKQSKAKQASKQASNATQANIKAFTATVETSEQQAGANQLA